MVAWCRRRRAGNAGIVRALFNRQGVAIAGRDGTLAQTGGTGSTALHPTYGSVSADGALISHSLAIPGVGTLPMSFAQGARTNLYLNSTAPATQNVTVATGSVTISAIGSGYTITSSAGTATATGYGLVPLGGSQTLTVTVAGTITLTKAGTAVDAYVNVEQAAFPGVKIITAGASLTRAADNILWTPPAALSTTSGEVVAIAAPYLWSAGAGVAGPNGSHYKLRNTASGITLYRESSTTERTDRSSDTATATSLAASSGVLAQSSSKWLSSTHVRLYLGATQSGEDAAVSAFAASADMQVGAFSPSAGHWFGFVGLIYVPGGLTDAERIALASVTGGSLTYVG